MTHRIQPNGPPGTGRSGLLWRTVLFAGAVCCLPLVSSAQFLRLGMFDVSMEAKLDLIYTTNVEGQRPSETVEEREDYYIVPELTLTGEAPFGRDTTLTLDTSLGFEKHFIRTDLDNETAPFGRVRLDSRTELARYTVNLYGGFEREYAEEDDIYVPGNRSSRDVTDTLEYGGEVIWSWRSLELGGHYDFSMERHLDPTFEDGDEDETAWGADVTWQLRPDLSATYSYERTRTVLIHGIEDEPVWEVDESLTLDWELPLWERPKITYSLGAERESVIEDPEEEGSGEWELTHALSAEGEWDLSSVVRLTLNADYQYEKVPEEDDIAFTYGAGLEHEISRTAKQTLTADREPVDTFGSKNDTDSTTVEYQFSKNDLFVYGLQLAAGVSWSRDEPMEEGSVVEKTVEYTLTLTHSRALSRRLARELMYEYTVEDSNLEDELLIEHRVTLTFTYLF